jgi:hypothetical protein
MKRRKLLLAAIVFIVAGCGGSSTNVPQDVSLANQGFENLTSGNYVQAEATLLVALDLNPTNPYALLNLGAVYQDTGRTEEAVEMYEKILQLNPGEAASESNRQEYSGETLVEIAKENLRSLGVIVAEKNPITGNTELGDSEIKSSVIGSRDHLPGLSNTAAKSASALDSEGKQESIDIALGGGPSGEGDSGIGASAGTTGGGESGSGSGSGGSGGGSGGDLGGASGSSGEGDDGSGGDGGDGDSGGDNGSGDDGGDDGSGSDGGSAGGDGGDDGDDGHGGGHGHGHGHSGGKK